MIEEEEAWRVGVRSGGIVTGKFVPGGGLVGRWAVLAVALRHHLRMLIVSGCSHKGSAIAGPLRQKVTCP